MATLSDLAKRMDRLAASIPKQVSDHAVSVALTVVGDLAFKTPVDTSQAISNWTVNVGMPALSFLPPHYPGQRGSTYSASAAETIALAKAVLKNKQPGQTIFISNNAPYIRKLNDGSSKQEPAGFVERAVLLGNRQAAKFKLKVK